MYREGLANTLTYNKWLSSTSQSKEIILVLKVDYLVKVIHELLKIWQFKAVYDSNNVRVKYAI